MKSQLMSTDDYNTFSQLMAASMTQSHRPQCQRWNNTQNDVLHLVAEVNAPNNWNRGTVLPKIATGRSAKSAKRLWQDYEHINIRSSIQQRLENPQEPSIYSRVPKNPKGLYDKPVTDPRPFNILHCRSFNVSREEDTLRQMYSQMSFLANAVRNTDGTTSYKNLCVNPQSRLMSSKERVQEEQQERSNSLRWPSASLNRPIPRLLLPLRPGSSTQWYAWKVDTPRKGGMKQKRSPKRDAKTSFVQHFRGDKSIISNKETSEPPFIEDTSREVTSSRRQTHNSFVSEADPSVTIASDDEVIVDSKKDIINERTVSSSQVIDGNGTFLTQSGLKFQENSVERENNEEHKDEERKIKDDGKEKAKSSLTEETLSCHQTKTGTDEKKETMAVPNREGQKSPPNKDKIDENCGESDETTGNETSDQIKLEAEEEKETSATFTDDGKGTPPKKDQDEENCNEGNATTGHETKDNLDDTMGVVVDGTVVQDSSDGNVDNTDREVTENVTGSEHTEEKTTENENNDGTEIVNGDDGNVRADTFEVEKDLAADEPEHSSRNTCEEGNEASDSNMPKISDEIKQMNGQDESGKGKEETAEDESIDHAQ